MRKLPSLSFALIAVLAAAPTLTAFAQLPTSSHNAASLPWMDTRLAPEKRAALLVSALTLQQKQQQITRSVTGVLPELPNCLGGRHVSGIPELSIPTFRITNGPVGIGQNDCVSTSINPKNLIGVFVDASSAKATAMPAAIGMAASFDPAAAAEFGDVVGRESRNLALQEFEAPGANLARLPVLGRNFEYFGEDPYLTGAMATAETLAVQKNGVIAMGKHFVANEQETNRMNVAEIVDDQVLHELYLLPFEMMVKDGKVGSMMCSYNTINGYQACQNPDMLNKVLRSQWGFAGYVQSDFGAAHSATSDLLSGMDLETSPMNALWNPKTLDAAMASGTIQVGNIDTALLRRYTQMFRMGIFDRPLTQSPVNFVAGGRRARAIGARTLVLLQNNGVLPLSTHPKNVVVFGKTTQPYAQQAVAGGARVGVAFGAGGGSSDVVPASSVAPVAGIRALLAKESGSSATVRLVLVDDANQNATVDGKPVSFAAALATAAAADQVIIMAGTISEEGADRAAFRTTAGTDLTQVGDNLDWYAPLLNRVTTTAAAGNSHTAAMIQALLAATSTTGKTMAAKTVLVLKDTAGVALGKTLVGAEGPAILEAWFPGQEDGTIVAEALYGMTAPSGKLPVTIPFEGETFMQSLTPQQYPGVLQNGMPTVTYEEKLNIGYRWYDTHSIRPAFPFGFGLSYTTFVVKAKLLSSATKDTLLVQATVRNTGKRDGSEVVQVYLGLPNGGLLQQPPRRLVGFQRVAVPRNGVRSTVLSIRAGASNHPLSVWDENRQQFVIPKGTFTIYAGTSSRDLVSVGTFEQ